MGKEKIFYKWWFQIIVIIAVLALFLVAFYIASPITKINKNASSYKIDKADSSPQKVLSVFLRSIYTEDVDLFKKTITPRTLYDYEDDYYNRHITDENIKDELIKTNTMMKKEFGDKWFLKTVFEEYGTETHGDNKQFIVKVKWDSSKETYITSEKLGLEYFVTPITMREFLHDNRIE